MRRKRCDSCFSRRSHVALESCIESGGGGGEGGEGGLGGLGGRMDVQHVKAPSYPKQPLLLRTGT